MKRNAGEVLELWMICGRLDGDALGGLSRCWDESQGIIKAFEVSCNISRGICSACEVFVDNLRHYRDPEAVGEGVIAQELVHWHCMGARTGRLSHFGMDMTLIQVIKALWTRTWH